MKHALFVLMVATHVAACRPRATVFVCRADSQCVLEDKVGVCEPSGFCSFPDGRCAGGRRHGRFALAGLADRCVGPPRCGNGRLDVGEECDDGNQVNEDGCTAGCLRCPPGGAAFAWGRDGRCYQRRDEPASWPAAQRACADDAGHLAVLSTPEETEAVSESLLPDVATTLWVGLSEGEVEGHYQWLTREPFDSVAWHTGYPRGYGAERGCGAITRGAAGPAAIADGPCEVSLGFLCERAPVFVAVDSEHRYALVGDALGWDEARARCTRMGGHLVTLGSADEIALVTRRFRGEHWIGARRAPGARPAWITGERWVQAPAPIAVGAPSDQGDCVAVSEGRWRLRACETRLPGLCEIAPSREREEP